MAAAAVVLAICAGFAAGEPARGPLRKNKGLESRTKAIENLSEPFASKVIGSVPVPLKPNANPTTETNNPAMPIKSIRPQGPPRSIYLTTMNHKITVPGGQLLRFGVSVTLGAGCDPVAGVDAQFAMPRPGSRKAHPRGGKRPTDQDDRRQRRPHRRAQQLR